MLALVGEHLALLHGLIGLLGRLVVNQSLIDVLEIFDYQLLVISLALNQFRSLLEAEVLWIRRELEDIVELFVVKAKIDLLIELFDEFIELLENLLSLGRQDLGSILFGLMLFLHPINIFLELF